ncbi:MAG: ankyrin repeat domain-containing protein [Coxiellaceae bacterium]|nr:ankyrin repeat domain-containing protein [Coxiellaceae bacterium]
MKWQQALDTGNEECIMNALLNIWDSNDRDRLLNSIDLKADVRIVRIVSKVLQSKLPQLQQDKYSIAKALWQKGAQLPPVATYLHDSDYSMSIKSQSLLENPYDLFIALCNNPGIIIQQDEDGKTLLHYAAALISTDKVALCQEVLSLLFAENVDLSIQDANGDTAVHLAVSCLCSFHLRDCIVKQFVVEAVKRNFNFNIKNSNGMSPLHLAVNTPHKNTDAVKTLLVNAPQIDIDFVSSDGYTALGYAVINGNLNTINELLIAGADPAKRSSKGSPITIVEGIITEGSPDYFTKIRDCMQFAQKNRGVINDVRNMIRKYNRTCHKKSHKRYESIENIEKAMCELRKATDAKQTETAYLALMNCLVSEKLTTDNSHANRNSCLKLFRRPSRLSEGIQRLLDKYEVDCNDYAPRSANVTQYECEEKRSYK